MAQSLRLSLAPSLRAVGRHDSLRRWLPAALFTCLIALYNQYPLTYPDSGNYLDNAYAIAHGRRPWFFFRPLTYGVFLLPFARPFALWLIPLAQGFLAAWVVDLSLRTSGVRLSTRAFLALFAGLSAFTILPWFSGQIMPDIFTSLVILLCFVFIWGDGRLWSGEWWAAGVLLTLAIGCHLSHLPLFAVLVAGTLGGRLAIDRSFRSRRRFVPVALRATAPLVAAVGFLIASNYYFHRRPVLSRSSSLFALAHLVGDGLVQRYLDRACPGRQYRLCSERGSLRADVDWFLWAPDGPRTRHEVELQRGDSTFLREAQAIVAGTLRQQWPAAIRASSRNAVAQLVTFGPHRGELAASASVEAALTRLGPSALRSYRASRQVRGSLPVRAGSRMQYAAVGLGLLMLLGSLPALLRSGSRPMRALIATVGLGLVLNALVMASLARVHPRYQGRVVWLVPLVGAVAALHVVGTRGRSPRD